MIAVCRPAPGGGKREQQRGLRVQRAPGKLAGGGGGAARSRCEGGEGWGGEGGGGGEGGWGEGISSPSPGWGLRPGAGASLAHPLPPSDSAPAFLGPGAVIPESDLSRVRQRLRKFLLKRPTLQSLREKGYIKGTWGNRSARRRGPRGRAALTSLSPRPGVRLRAGRAVRARKELRAALRATVHPHRRGPGYAAPEGLPPGPHDGDPWGGRGGGNGGKAPEWESDRELQPRPLQARGQRLPLPQGWTSTACTASVETWPPSRSFATRWTMVRPRPSPWGLKTPRGAEGLFRLLIPPPPPPRACRR